jgi:hypothetical protein
MGQHADNRHQPLEQQIKKESKMNELVFFVPGIPQPWRQQEILITRKNRSRTLDSPIIAKEVGRCSEQINSERGRFNSESGKRPVHKTLQ